MIAKPDRTNPQSIARGLHFAAFGQSFFVGGTQPSHCQVNPFPRDLAIGLKSGRVVARVTLHADGTLFAVLLHAGSGYRGFDDALVDALRRIGPLGPVPAALLGPRPQLGILIPYTFKSSMIR